MTVDDTVTRWLDAHRDWQLDDGAIVRAVEAPDFPAGIALVTRVAAVAEERNHHPDIDIRWRTVTFRLVTHSAGMVTAADLDLAEAIDTLV
jgi:4a-hydroxytetrahydrobiopterin dehydratase